MALYSCDGLLAVWAGRGWERLCSSVCCCGQRREVGWFWWAPTGTGTLSLRDCSTLNETVSQIWDGRRDSSSTLGKAIDLNLTTMPDLFTFCYSSLLILKPQGITTAVSTCSGISRWERMDHIARSVQGITEYFKWTICVCLYPSPSWLSLRILFPQVNSASRIHFSGWPSFGCASCQDKRIDIEMASKRSSFLTIVLPCTRPRKLQQAHRVVACQLPCYSSIAIPTQQPTL